MKTQLIFLSKSAKNLLKEIEKTIMERENYFSSKSEKWQESNLGEKFQENTEQLNDASDLIAEGIDIMPN
jgi:hypothetical protein